MLCVCCFIYKKVRGFTSQQVLETLQKSGEFYKCSEIHQFRLCKCLLAISLRFSLLIKYYLAIMCPIIYKNYTVDFTNFMTLKCANNIKDGFKLTNETMIISHLYSP